MSKKIAFTTAYNRTNESIRDCNVQEFTQPSKVKASLAYAVDINEIYKNYCRTGQLPLNGQKPIYDENFIKYDSLIDAQKIVAQASEYFNGLPADIKNQYGNNIERFVQALNSKDDFLIKKGLLKLPTSEPSDIDIKIPETTSATTSQTTETMPVNTAPTD